jgi:hypothetical protein
VGHLDAGIHAVHHRCLPVPRAHPVQHLYRASLKADIGRLGNLGERALGFFHLGTGFWLFYLMFADILNATLHFTLFI